MARHETPPIAPHPGMTLGKYRLERLLGRGGMASVWLATHVTLGAPVAVKLLDPAIAAADPRFVGRFLREAQLAARIHHPNLVAVLDVGRDPLTGLNYLVMEYLPGGSVSGLIAKCGALPEAEATRIVRQVAEALRQAERYRLVHRDIKPDNILFGERGEAKLADLGIAKAELAGAAELTQTSAVFGTPAYMSPEQARDSGKVDVRADIYSLGVVFYEMLTARRPYGGATLGAILTQLLEAYPPPSSSPPRTTFSPTSRPTSPAVSAPNNSSTPVPATSSSPAPTAPLSVPAPSSTSPPGWTRSDADAQAYRLAVGATRGLSRK